MRKVIPFLLSFCLCVWLCACSSQKDYPTKYKDSQAKTISDVLDTSFPKTDVISDGSIALVDTTNASQGYIGCQLLSDPGSKVKLIVEKDDKKYTYDIDTTEMVGIPLSCGSGDYSIRIAQNMEGTTYSIIASGQINVQLADDKLPFLYPNKIVNYHRNSQVVSLSMEVCKKDTNDLERIESIYSYVLKHLTYDKKKAKAADNQYMLPDLDEVLKTGKGICFDYASLMAAMCRVQGIPCRVVVGATDIEYHAWCEIYLKGKGWINPKVYFKAKKWSLVDPTFADSGNDYEGKYQEDYHY